MSNLLNKLMTKMEEDIHACVDEKMTYGFFDALSFSSKSDLVYRDREASRKEAEKRERLAEVSLKKFSTEINKYDRSEYYAGAVSDILERLNQRLIGNEEYTPNVTLRMLEELSTGLNVTKLNKNISKTGAKLAYISPSKSGRKKTAHHSRRKSSSKRGNKTRIIARRPRSRKKSVARKTSFKRNARR